LATRSLDLGRALTYMFEEEGWVSKFLIGAALLLVIFGGAFLPIFFLVPIMAAYEGDPTATGALMGLFFLIMAVFIFFAMGIGLLLNGYLIEVIRRVGHGITPALPSWGQWGVFLRKGFFAMLAGLVYSLPMVFIYCVGIGLFVASVADTGGELSGGFSVMFLFCIFPLVFLGAIPIMIFYTAAMVRYAETDRFSAFFEFGRVWGFVRANLSNFIVALLVTILASFVGSFVPVLGTIWYYFASGHILGQVLAIAREKEMMGGSEQPLYEAPL
jgi:hypothetical protein